MRRALIADIHGNSVALEAALRDCKQQRIDEIVCLGDMVSFGPDPVECVDTVRNVCKWSLLGDHDAALFMQSPSGFNPTLCATIERQRRALLPHWYSCSKKRERWKWLESLELQKSYAGALFVHASPRDPLIECIIGEDFMTPPLDKITDIFSRFEGLCFAAHSHRPGIAYSAESWSKPTSDKSVFQVSAATKTYINVGSVGQPRDGDPRSCYAIWDDVENSVTFRRVEYDLAAIKKRFYSVPELNGMYYERLVKGM